MSVRRYILSGLVVSAMLAGTSSVFAGNNNKLPSGHSYSPYQQRLPNLNSRRDRLNSRADIYEAEIDRINRETAITFGNMRIFGHDRWLRGGSSNRPHFR